MILIPAIDLKGGRCVRLVQGRMEDETVYSQNPLSQARRWVEAGAERLHVVDLDGAVSGVPAHIEAISEIVRAFPEIPVEVGGGIRTIEAAQAYLQIGVEYVIVGTRAVSEPQFVAQINELQVGSVIAGLDVIDGRIAVDGWTGTHQIDVVEIAQSLESQGAAAIISTDIRRDGMLSGADIGGATRLASELTIPVIIAGGIASMRDIEQLILRSASGVQGAIVGKALYEGRLDLAEAQSYVSSHLN